MPSEYGNIFVPSNLERSVRDLLKGAFPAYLREVERLQEWEREPLRAPRNYTTRNSFDDLVGEETPKVVVISPGLFNEPEHVESDGYYQADWHLGVGIAIAAPTEDLADAMVKMYGAAARAILVNHQDLMREDVTQVHWLDENYDDLPINDQLQLYKVAQIWCAVTVQEVVSRFKRPIAPFPYPETPQETGEVDTVIVEIPDWEKEIIVP